jgi:acyl-CoA thioesterase
MPFLKKENPTLKANKSWNLTMSNEKDILANKVVDRMMKDDLFSQWLGIVVIEVREGYSKIKMNVRDEMLNGLGIVHGGIAFSLADSAFAFACNNRDNLSVALDTSINFTKPVHVGDELVAEAREIHNGKSTGLYHITIFNQNQHAVAIFKGTCFRTGKSLLTRL